MTVFIVRSELEIGVGDFLDGDISVTVLCLSHPYYVVVILY